MVALIVATFLVAAPAAAGPTPPPPNIDFDYQLGGAAKPAANVGIVARDRTAAPAAGVYNICYVNGFQTQPNERRFWKRHWGLVLKRDGKPVLDSAWGEWLLDIRTPAKRAALSRIMSRWISGCAEAGYDAVEFDNLDSWSRSRGLLTRGQARSYAGLLVDLAHDAGLSAGQKNWAEWDGSTVGYDFAIAEECGRWRECDRYVESYGDEVFVIEYRRADFAAVCAAYGDRLSVVLRDLALTPDGIHRWC